MEDQSLQAFLSRPLTQEDEIHRKIKFCFKKNGVETVRNLVVEIKYEDIDVFFADEFEKVRNSIRKIHHKYCSRYRKLEVESKNKSKRAAKFQPILESDQLVQQDNAAKVPNENFESSNYDRTVYKSDAAQALSTVAEVQAAKPHESDNADSKTGDSPVPSSIEIGVELYRNKFRQTAEAQPLNLPLGESGLKRHLLICGATGSGKTVAARQIIEQAACRGIPSIVVDAQGDLSSLVILPDELSEESLYERASAIQQPCTSSDEDELRQNVREHLEALTSIGKNASTSLRHLKESVVARVFTPGRSRIGLPLAFPKCVDLTAGLDTIDPDNTDDMEELIIQEASNLVSSLSELRKGCSDWYQEILTHLFRHAQNKGMSFDGRSGIKRLIELASKCGEICPDRWESLSKPERNKFIRAITTLDFEKEGKWFEGTSFNVGKLVESVSGKTPINIINLHLLNTPEDKKRVLRHIIVSTLRHGMNNPPLADRPSLLLYIDEVGSGYGEKSIAKPEADSPYKVYDALRQLVKVGRKYGISAVLASQDMVDFQPSIRSQTQSRIIGRLTEAAETRRAVKAIAEGLESTGNVKELVEERLPGLDKPHLIFVGTKGQAFEYRQHKCMTLDLVLTDDEITRWRANCEKELQEQLASAERDLQAGLANEAVKRIDTVLPSAMFFPTEDALKCAKARACVKLGLPSEAESIYKDLRDRDSIDLNYLRPLQVDLADYYEQTGQEQEFVEILESVIEHSEDKPDSFYYDVQLRLAKHKIFTRKELTCARDNLVALKKSGIPKRELFASMWTNVLNLFGRWSKVSGFFIDEPDCKITLYEEGASAGTVIIQKLPIEEDAAEAAKDFTSTLLDRKGLLLVSLTDKKEASERNREKAFKSFGELSVLQEKLADAEKLKAGAREAVEKRDFREAVKLYIEYYENFGITDIKDEIENLERDPVVRSELIGLWIDSLTWRQFEMETATLFCGMGYAAFATKATGDDGVDVRATRDGRKYVIQCKKFHENNLIGKNYMKELHATRMDEEADCAVMVALPGLQSGAKSYAEEHGIEYLEKVDLVKRFCKFYFGQGVVPGEETPVPSSRPGALDHFGPGKTQLDFTLGDSESGRTLPPSGGYSRSDEVGNSFSPIKSNAINEAENDCRSIASDGSNLAHTRILEARIGEEFASNWNRLLEAALRLACEKGLTLRELRRRTSVNLREGNVPNGENGYRFIPEIEMSFQGVSAPIAFRCTYEIAKLIGAEFHVSVQWRNNARAAYPGDEGVFSYLPDNR